MFEHLRQTIGISPAEPLLPDGGDLGAGQIVHPREPQCALFRGAQATIRPVRPEAAPGSMQQVAMGQPTERMRLASKGVTTDQ